MVKIGDFARAGQVSVRMLRHYDRLGLLTPAAVDPWSGHRSYTPDQLQRLDRIVALNSLGFTLDEVGDLLDADLTGAEFAGRLRARRLALAEEAHAVHRRLAEVTRRLQHLENQEPHTMPEFVTKTLPADRIVGLSGRAAAQPEIAGVVGPLFDRVAAALTAAGQCPETGVALYQWTEAGAVDLFAGYRCAADVPGLEVRDLPGVEAVTAVHLGAMSGVRATWEALDRHVGEQGWSFAGPCREVYLEAGDGTPGDDQSTWVTELQQPIAR